MGNFNIDATIVIAIIAAAATIIAPAISYFLTKHFERESDWRSRKLEHYKAFMTAASSVLGGGVSAEALRVFTAASNDIVLFGSKDVVIALDKFLEHNEVPGQPEYHVFFTKLVVAIRKDMGMKDAGLPEGQLIRLRSGSMKGVC